MNSEPDRYHRQTLLHGIGEAGQRRLSESTALILGCGALGCVVSDMLARSGVGHLVIVDRDVPELTNLQRQVLFDEQDVADGIPKSEAAKRRLTAVNSDIRVSAFVDDINHTNIERYATAVDVIVDGLDNFETRYLANDMAVKHGVPYVYGAAVATSGMAFPVLPHADGSRPWESAGETNLSTPCFRCLFDEAPPPGTTATCDTVGVLNSLIGIVANFQVTETLKILTGNFAAVNRKLLTIDPWTNDISHLAVDSAYAAGDCRCCKHREFAYLDGASGSSAASLCGRNAVQLRSRNVNAVPTFATLAERLRRHGTVRVNDYLLRAEITDSGAPVEITLFTDGRAIIKGTADPATARSVYAKYVGT